MLSWRLERFLELGADVALAEKLAAGPVDWHELQLLNLRGCPVELAAAILA